jgi:5,10-methylenetetrahydrofolate reductase
MRFLRVVEVFPPFFPRAEGPLKSISLKDSMDELVGSVEAIQDCADLILVADVKNPELLKVSTIHVASIIKSRAGVDAAPVIMVRDSNRPQLRSAILTAFALGLDSIMLVWGDKYPAASHASNVYDYGDLSETIAEAVSIGESAGLRPRILAPVNLFSLTTKSVVARARSRLDAGAELLLAQPPTTDTGSTFIRHVQLIESSGLKSKVLLSSFPFWSVQDVKECETNFGWKLPPQIHELAKSGERPLLEEAHSVATKVRESGLPGIYVSTRGRPELARAILDHPQ